MATTGVPRNATLLTAQPEEPSVTLFSVGESGTRPSSPTKGYVFSNTSDLTIEQWTGSIWKVIGRIPEVQVPVGAGPTSQRPANPRLGYLYFDTTLGQLIAWGGTSWIVIGPSAATITPPLAPPQIVTQPTSQTIAVGNPASFTVAAVGTGVLSYQWYKDSVTLPGETASSYSIGSVAQSSGGSYTVRVTDSQGTVLSQAAVLTVVGAPYIVANPTSQTVASGGSATFTVIATGTAPLNYQWTFNGLSISGATASSYSINGVTSANAGAYAVTVTNGVGSVSSTSATLAVTTSATVTTWSSFTGTFVSGYADIANSALGFVLRDVSSTTTFQAVLTPVSGSLPPGIQLTILQNEILLNVAVSGGGEASLTVSYDATDDNSSYAVNVLNVLSVPTAVACTVSIAAGPGKFKNCSCKAPLIGPVVIPPYGFAIDLTTNTLSSNARLFLGLFEGESATTPLVAPINWDLAGDTTNNPVVLYLPPANDVTLRAWANGAQAVSARLEIAASDS